MPQHPIGLSISPAQCKLTEKRQTSHGYIIRNLQHFETKLWNIANFVMLFQAVMKFLSIDQNLVYNANGPLLQKFLRKLS